VPADVLVDEQDAQASIPAGVAYRERMGAERVHTVGRAARILTAAWKRPEGAVALAYHDVRPKPLSSPFDVTPDGLRRQLRFLREHCRVVTARELAAAAASGEQPNRRAAITFDDALLGVHEHALPLLVELGLPATVFVPSAELGRRPHWWPTARRVMTAAELAELVAGGIELGSHSRTHRSLTQLSDRALTAELAGSKAELEDLCGRRVDLLAYPFGDNDVRVRRAAAAAGYLGGYSFHNGRIVAGVDVLALPRLTMGRHHHAFRFAYHLRRDAASWPSPANASLPR
jgi:peptidoglycan/xylan/chitin deacetylase (PgdA/CDA1 family)